MLKSEKLNFKKLRVLAIGPSYDEKYQSIIYTPQEKFYSTHTVRENVELFCLSHGACLEGRKKYSRKRYKYVKNPSILISENHLIVAFQVPNLTKLDKIWIMDVKEVTILSLEDGTSEIILSNDEKLHSALSAKLVEKRRGQAESILHESSYESQRPSYILNISNT